MSCESSQRLMTYFHSRDDPKYYSQNQKPGIIVMPVYSYNIKVNLEEFFENLGKENMSDIRLDSFVEIHAASRYSKMQSINNREIRISK